jgi:uncharacterized membrane protein YdjX (TVP38/TMEM64 family)
MPTPRIGEQESPLNSEPKPGLAVSIPKWIFPLAFVTIFAVTFVLYRDQILQRLVATESGLREIQATAPMMTALVGLIIYILVAGLTPGAAFLSLAYGWFFGLWQGTLLVSFGSTAGATMMFLLSRYILRDWVLATKNVHIQKMQTAFEREGAYYLFSLRLIPAIPFFLVNILMGITKIRMSTFWWVSQLGMLPGTIAYIYAGTTLPSLKAIHSGEVNQILSWQLLLAFSILGILPWLMKRLGRMLGPRSN